MATFPRWSRSLAVVAAVLLATALPTIGASADDQPVLGVSTATVSESNEASLVSSVVREVPDNLPSAAARCSPQLGRTISCELPEGHVIWVGSLRDSNCPSEGVKITFHWGDEAWKLPPRQHVETFPLPCDGSLQRHEHLYPVDEMDHVTFTLTQTDPNLPSTAISKVTFTEGDFLVPVKQEQIKMEPNKPLSDKVVAEFTNPGYPEHVVEDFKAKIDWDDGTTTDGKIKAKSGDRGDFRVSGTHTYKEPAKPDGSPFTIKTKITDEGVDLGKAETKVAALEIVDADSGKLIPIEGTQKTVVGEGMHLKVKMSTDDPAVSNPNWSGLDGAVSDYTITASSATVADLNDGDLQSDTVQFHFWDIRDPGLHEISATTDQGSVKVKLDLQVPGGVSPNVTTCAAGINTAATRTTPHGNLIDPPSFGPGLNDACGNRPGIKWDFVVRAPQSRGGTIGLVQLLTTNIVTHNGNTCDGSATGRGADVASFFDSVDNPEDAFISVGAGQSATWSKLESDSPGIAFKRHGDAFVSPFKFGTWTKQFAATDYLMFKPEGNNSIWVPLGTMSWNFSMSVDLKLVWGLRWNLRQTSAVGPTRTAFTNGLGSLPTWNGVFAPVNTNFC